MSERINVELPDMDHVLRGIALAEAMSDLFFFVILENNRIIDLYSTRDTGLAVLHWREAGCPELFFGKMKYQGHDYWIQLAPTKIRTV